MSSYGRRRPHVNLRRQPGGYTFIGRVASRPRLPPAPDRGRRRRVGWRPRAQPSQRPPPLHGQSSRRHPHRARHGCAHRRRRSYPRKCAVHAAARRPGGKQPCRSTPPAAHRDRPVVRRERRPVRRRRRRAPLPLTGDRRQRRLSSRGHGGPAPSPRRRSRPAHDGLVE